MSDATTQAAQSAAATGQSATAAREESAERPVPHLQTPIVPQATISGRALMAVVAIMTFLASLTAGAVMLVRTAANEWQTEVGREVTIQIGGAAGQELDAEVAKAVAIVKAFPGIADVRPYSKEETTRLLEPWLGSGLRFDELPIPRIIVVRIAAGGRPNLGELRKLLAEQVPGASLDDHRGFVDRMRAMASAAVIGGIGVLVLVLLANVLSVTFATRAAIASNRPVIEVLHFIGARDSFIAGHFQHYFLQLGLKGGLIGGGSAVALFAFLDFANGWFLGTAAGDQFVAMFGTFSIGALGYLAIVVQIALVAAVTAIASRRTVNRTIETVH
jgi:cell division transport system permease protein